jgi:hypothetical protein
MNDDGKCGHNLDVPSTPNQVGYGYYCQLTSGHAGLHRWGDTASHEPERARVWNDLGTDFIEGPYPTLDKPDGITCDDLFTDAAKTKYSCTRPKGHSGQHGNQHDSDGPGLWPNYDDLPKLFGAGMDKLTEGAPIPADIEIVISQGAPAFAKQVRLNGMLIPQLHHVQVEYAHDDARTVVLEILATSVTEVPA